MKGANDQLEGGLLVLTKAVASATPATLLTQRTTTTVQDAIIPSKMDGAFRPRELARAVQLFTRALDAQVRQAQPACQG